MGEKGAGASGPVPSAGRRPTGDGARTAPVPLPYGLRPASPPRTDGAERGFSARPANSRDADDTPRIR
ncbi:hypothetical protein CRV15_24475 [Streptomyces clavuligerus]|uniref:Uncharacterized protein n=1 Tax=Streptomyces clavuligerus TaxID=1901 RepID=B5GWW2_STRCL|nr:hypothetical protein D1794_25105 [Streptomyces clavuligerus]EDY50808.1 hypothetical protein SSCG_03766 [Streptomyces clavuligerus]EFG05836.1 Hypothetical protein SCLAV_0760 [Streptomyces clavuligerus]QCS08478.1 hypothetical protein CRV15_24475 [Streptomyces clavuligerus]QPJ92185.1 hypothetical protein GE265_03655 [Streptomyces clavuligerus]